MSLRGPGDMELWRASHQPFRPNGSPSSKKTLRAYHRATANVTKQAKTARGPVVEKFRPMKQGSAAAVFLLSGLQQTKWV